MTTQIWFDGGARPTNPGTPYGSFQLRQNGTSQLKRWESPHTLKSNNEAEYMTLWLALNEAAERLTGTTQLEIYSDSALVVNQLKGNWKCREPRMAVLREKCTRLIKVLTGSTDRWSCKWVPRERMVELFGH